MKKRILVLLTVVALMVVMLAMAVAPAFAEHPDFHPTPSNSHASNNPSGRVSNCAVDPVCGETQVGHSTHESFPQGQERFQNH
jgi:hypothetical protein